MPTTISGLSFDIAAPFTAGYVLTEADAKVLNQTRSENVRNNTAARVKAILAEANTDAENASDEVRAKAAEAVRAYDAEYNFSTGRVGTPRITDPYESALKTFATQALRQKLAGLAKPIKFADYPEDKRNAALDKLKANPKLQALAKQKVAADAKQKAALADLGDIE